MKLDCDDKMIDGWAEKERKKLGKIDVNKQ